MLSHLVIAVRRQYFGIIALALVLAAGADAATGGNLVLGRLNTAGTTTTLRNTADGPALALTVKQGQPPLSVSNGVEVPRLNASRLNGKRSGDFAPAKGSPFYLPRGSWPLLVEDFKTPPGGGAANGNPSEGLRLPYFVFHSLVAPGNGLVRVAVFGDCVGHGHMTIDVNSTIHEVEVGDGVCGLARTFPVSLGQDLFVTITVSDFDEATTLELARGSLAVVFEPS